MPYETAFPDYPGASLPLIPAAWTDTSWKNDTCPSWTAWEDKEYHLRVFCDYPDAAQREIAETPRFSAYASRLDGGAMIDLGASDDWQDMLSRLLAFMFARDLREQMSFVEHEAMRRDNARQPESSGVCHSHDYCDANISMDAAFTALCLPLWKDEMQDGESGLREEAVELWGRAWAVARREYLGGYAA